MRSESTSAFGQPRETKEIRGAAALLVGSGVSGDGEAVIGSRETARRASAGREPDRPRRASGGGIRALL
ncbi:hypothetical protein MOX02_17010 [Methylobacterium oxalidis]|uniref:Uncharacterized protein n=1 Tax=Methylobacterium oxalidis TaxID=944322 RepID=A0A512J184_9HYPH|nr:hypothetical protein MOX02_17010 [Methylobacterium oxalidis]GLS64990.1 hypothetical protein GCM10007888_33710 [Methylobacterium oxalidis]